MISRALSLQLIDIIFLQLSQLNHDLIRGYLGNLALFVYLFYKQIKCFVVVVVLICAFFTGGCSGRGGTLEYESDVQVPTGERK